MLAPLASRLKPEYRSLASLAPLADEWRRLAARAIEPNVFYEPAFALPAAAAFGPDAHAVCVRDGEGCLAGIFPLRIECLRYGLPFPVLSGFVHPFGPLGTPLADSGNARETAGAFLDCLVADRSLPRILLMPFLPEEGPFAAAFGAALAERNLRAAAFGRHRRAMLAPAVREDYSGRAMDTKTRKELRRQRRRLSELGTLAHSSADDASDVAAVLEQFLALEAKGWKGRVHSAAVQNPAALAFVREAVTALAREGKARGDVLSLDGRAVATILTLCSGGTAWSWKITYDEAFARYSPGVQAMLDLTHDLLADPAVMRTDSCATSGHPMIDRLWSERLALSDRLICLDPGFSPAFAVACGLEAARRAALPALKRFRSAMTR